MFKIKNLKYLLILVLYQFTLSNCQAQPCTQQQCNEIDIIQCSDDNDCPNFYICNQLQQCERKGIFPLTADEIVGSILLIFGVGAGQAAGVGGGLVIIPIVMQFFGLETKKGIAVVFIIIFFASFVNLLRFVKQRSSRGDPLIDYKLILISLPAVFVGSTYGVSINQLIPEFFICAALIYFIIQNTKKCITQYKKQRQKEIEESNSLVQKKQSTLILDMVDECQSPILKEIIVHQTDLYPKKLIQQIFIVSIIFIVFSLFRGSKKFESIIGIPICSFEYWAFTIFLFFAQQILTKYFQKQFMDEDQIKTSLGYKFRKGEQTTPENVKMFSFLAFYAGCLGSIIGIGGGMVLVPKWLELGMSPSRTSACSISILFFTSLNSFLQFFLANIYGFDEIFYYGILSLISSQFVSNYILTYVNKHNKSSYLILIMIVFMAFSFTYMSIKTIGHAFNDFYSLFQIGNLC